MVLNAVKRRRHRCSYLEASWRLTRTVGELEDDDRAASGGDGGAATRAGASKSMVDDDGVDWSSDWTTVELWLDGKKAAATASRAAKEVFSRSKQ
ncbi:uncharacterized protein J3R85_018050 [Psidium guajava]|nr:uncharacterized protein J3R85_018050 [Psidium guajava]